MDKETLYARWLEGDLTSEEEAQLKASNEWAELESIVTTTDRWTLPAYNHSTGYKQLRDRTKPTSSRTFHLNQLYTVAAAMLILVSLFFWFTGRDEEILAPPGMTQQEQLPDGSEVILNDGSSLTYDKKSYSDVREIHLIGEAYFLVEKGAPFTVVTEQGKVSVLGTSFNVRSWGSKLYVECYTGKVEVAKTHKQILTSGMTVNVIGDEMKIDSNKDLMQPAWLSEQSIFHQEKIESVFQEIERQFDADISVTVTGRHFSGSFSHTDIEVALDMVCKPMGLNYEKDDRSNSYKVF